MDKSYGILLATAVVAATHLPSRGFAQEYLTERPTTCPPGFTIVEDIAYRAVCKKVCHIVPDVRSMRVPAWDVRCDWKCKVGCPDLKARNKGCPPCEFADSNCFDHDLPPKGCGKIRKVRHLIRRSAEEDFCGYKCVVEEVVEQVPCKVWRQVPCVKDGQ